MLRAYIDDSKSEGPQGAFVLAGYLAEATKWEAFSGDWQAALKQSPPLEYLKTKDAFRLGYKNSQFYGWTQEQRDSRLFALARIVNRYALRSIQCIIHVGDYRKVFAGRGHADYDRPYFFAFHSVVGALASHLYKLDINDQIEIIFDEQGGESAARIQLAWDDFISTAPPNLTRRLGGRPSFGDERQIRPLQAADLMAWHVRRNIFERARGKELKSAVWDELLNLPRLTGLWQERKLRKMLDIIMKRQLIEVPTVAMTLPDPSSRWNWKG